MNASELFERRVRPCLPLLHRALEIEMQGALNGVQIADRYIRARDDD
jgi:hypothetical protein